MLVSEVRYARTQRDVNRSRDPIFESNFTFTARGNHFDVELRTSWNYLTKRLSRFGYLGLSVRLSVTIFYNFVKYTFAYHVSPLASLSLAVLFYFILSGLPSPLENKSIVLHLHMSIHFYLNVSFLFKSIIVHQLLIFIEVRNFVQNF